MTRKAPLAGAALADRGRSAALISGRRFPARRSYGAVPRGQSALGHRVSAQSRLVRPVYDLRAEAKDDGENFLLFFGSNLNLVQHIFKVPGHDFKITSSDAETMVRLLSGSANHFTRSAGHIAQ